MRFFVGLPAQMLYVWYIYLQNWVMFRVNVGKYSIHGAYGQRDPIFQHHGDRIFHWFFQVTWQHIETMDHGGLVAANFR